jgi:putative membrane protein
MTLRPGARGSHRPIGVNRFHAASVLDAAMDQDLDQTRRTSMAAERTWLAWWRSAIAATAGALGVGRLAPELLQVAPWPYIVLGCLYASLAIGLLLVGAQRQRDLEDALRTGRHSPLLFRTVGLFTTGGIALAVLTVVLVVAQT